MDWLANVWAVYSNLVLSLGTNALLALSIYVTLCCGMLAMANAAFMGIGAYVSALLTMNCGAPFALSLAAGMIVPMAVSFLIGRPALRLSGVYLAMATLSFGEVVRVVILNMENLTGGALGLNGIPQLTQWWHVAGADIAVLVVLYRMRCSKLWRAFGAIRGDETAASLMGIDVTGHKLLAFMLGAALAGLAGVLNAHLTFFIGPSEFGFERGVDILTMAVLGGINGLMGPIVGSTILTLLPEFLRGLGDLHLAANGLALALIVLFLPKGIWNPLGLRRALRSLATWRRA